MSAGKHLTVGARVLVQLYDGRVFLGIVKAVHDTVSGRKVAVQHEQMAWRLDADQILRTVRAPKGQRP